MVNPPIELQDYSFPGIDILIRVDIPDATVYLWQETGIIAYLTETGDNPIESLSLERWPV